MQEGKYKYGFTTDVESEQLPAGLNEETIIAISQKKDEPQTDGCLRPVDIASASNR